MKNEIKEFNGEDYGFFIVSEKKLFEKKTIFQKIELYQHKVFGKVLRLDDCFQTSEFDEFFYHESLVQFPLFTHPNPEKILLIGGGDGGALKEIVKHSSIKKIDFIEIDGDVVEISKEYLKEINKNSFEDKRVNLMIEDGLVFLENTKNFYDIIILDLTDPSGESEKLYNKEFYELVSKKLKKDGVLSLQIGDHLFEKEIFIKTISSLKSVFKHISIHSVFIPIYGIPLSFSLCSNDIDFEKVEKSILEKRINLSNIKDLKYFDASIYKASLVQAPYLKDLIKTN